MRFTTFAAALLVLAFLPAPAGAQDAAPESAPYEVAPAPRPVTIIVVPTVAPALVLAQVEAIDAVPDEPAPARSARGSIGTKLATVGAGVGMFALGWVATFVGTMIWYFDTTDCMGAGIGLLSDPDGPYRCSHRGPNDDALGASFIPLVGPWVMLNTPNVDPGFPIAMGIVQAAGALTLAIGVPLAWSDGEGRDVAFDVRGEPGGATLIARGHF